MEYSLLKAKTVEGNYASILDFKKLPFLERVPLITEGMTKRQLENFKEVTGLTWDRIANLLGVTVRTLHMVKGNEILNHRITDKFLALVDFYCRGYTQFQNRLYINEYLDTPLPSMGYIVALDFMPYSAVLNDLKSAIFPYEPKKIYP